MEYINERWKEIAENVPEEVLYIGVTFGLHLFFFWSLSLIFRYIDLHRSPDFIYRRKIQSNKNVTREEYREIVECALFQQFFVMIPFSISFKYFASMMGRELDFGPLPSLLTTLLHFGVFLLLEDFFFYTIHYLLHRIPYLYQSIHKKHHRFKAPVGAASIYAHPIEIILADILPVMIGPFVMKTHIVLLWIWFVIATSNTVITHSGYSIWSGEHDYHHETFMWNYGIGFFDFLFGTQRFRSNPSSPSSSSSSPSSSPPSSSTSSNNL